MRLIDENGNQKGVVAIKKALDLANEAGYDLVEIAANSNPPVCKILDYGKFRYEKQKQLKINKKKQHTVQVKEIRLRPNTGDHDLTTKLMKAQKFLLNGDKLKVTVMFRGREMQHTHLGNKLMQRIINDTASLGKVEIHPKFEGKQIIMIVQPL